MLLIKGLPTRSFICLSVFQGPPPDPQYNFLSDRTRDKPRVDFKDKKQGEKENRNGDKNNNNHKDLSRRHPKNFGGTDFSNVKGKMKEVKERQVCVDSYFSCDFASFTAVNICIIWRYLPKIILSLFILIKPKYNQFFPLLRQSAVMVPLCRLKVKVTSWFKTFLYHVL